MIKKKTENIEKLLEEYPDSELLKADGFDECIIGICDRYGQEQLVAYDKEKVIKKLMKDKMSYEEAIEYFEFNIIGAWVGEKTPVFITKISTI